MKTAAHFRKLCFFTLTSLLPALAFSAEQRCSPAVATLESMEGTVSWRVSDNDAWRTSALNAQFCYGDTLRIIDGRAALRLTNDTLVRLNSNSMLKLIPQEQSLWVELLRGAGHFLSRTPNPFRVNTPYLNAAVDGTEFLVDTDADAAQTRVAVFEGQVIARNDAGMQTLTAGEQTSSAEGSAPGSPTTVSLADAVDWALYYPPVVVHADTPPAIQTAIREGRYQQALDAIRDNRQTPTDPNLAALGAGLALERGAPETADALLLQATDADSEHVESRALSSLITLIRGDADTAHQTALSLREQHSENSTVLMVLSYTAQGQADLPLALEAAEQALAQAPDNELIRARTAELMLAQGRHGQARQLINASLEGGDATAKTWSLAGFIELNHFATGRALEHFQQALQRDNANPQAHFGTGLAEIQRGNLTKGRESIELAVLLDPGNSLLRSYLGKSYYEERRFSVADEQFKLAQQLDPDDPTPWFYQSHLRQSQNRLADALQLTETAISKNDNRAVYRSRLLLDSDVAARSADRSDLYQALGFHSLAAQVAADAITVAPADHSGHRALASALSHQPRAQQAKASEALQAEILAPLGATPLPPGFSETSLGIHPALGPSRMGINEFHPLFAQRGLSGFVSGMAGTDDLRSLTWQARMLANKTALTVGQFHYDDAGITQGREIEKEITEVLGQYQVFDQLQIQAKYVEREDSRVSDPTDMQQVNDIDRKREDKSVRLRYTAGGVHTIILDWMESDLDVFDSQTITFVDDSSQTLLTDSFIERRKTELAYLLDLQDGWMKMGITDLSTDTTSAIAVHFDPPSEPFESGLRQEAPEKFRKYYVEHYRGFNEDALGLTLGLSKPEIEPDFYNDQSLYSIALHWRMDDRLTMHTAYWQDVAPRIVGYLESSNISAFNRRSETSLWSRTESLATNLDYQHDTFRTGLTLQLNRINNPLESFDFVGIEAWRQFDEYNLLGSILWKPSNWFTTSLNFDWTIGEIVNLSPIDTHRKLDTLKIPLTLAFFPRNVWSYRAEITRIDQTFDMAYQPQFDSSFTNINISANWNPITSPISASIGLWNILDEDTEYLMGSVVTDGQLFENEFVEFAQGISAFVRLSIKL